jgi:hypothetical protein
MLAPKYSLAALAGESVIFNENSENPDNVRIQPRGSAERPLCASCVGAVSSTFGKSLVFLSTKPGASYLVVDTGGQVLMTGGRRKSPDFISRSSGAANRNRVAYLYGATHLAVLDIDVKREVWDHEAVSQPESIGNMGTRFTAPRIALSPDGHKLAILTSRTVSVFNIR